MNYQGYNVNGGAGNGSNNSGNNNQAGTLPRGYSGMSMIPQPTLMALSAILTIGPYKHRKDLTRESVLSKYQILGYIAAGTYGKVYKARSKRPQEGKDTEFTDGDTNPKQPLTNNNDNSGGITSGGKVGTNSQNFKHPNNLYLNKNLGGGGVVGVGGVGGVGGGNGGSGGGNFNGSSNVTHNYPNNTGGTTNNANSSNNNHLGHTGLNGPNRQPNALANAMHMAANNQPISLSSSSSSSSSSLPGNKTNTEDNQLFAIKKFKNDNHLSNKNYNHDINGNEIIHYTGISQSAIREMSICREINNKNITKTIDILLENKSIYIVSEFCEHDLLQIIHYHLHPEIRPIPERTVKSLIWQILNGVLFLHKNWIFHRDLKPANIMVTSGGVVKIGDLGLARKFNNPLQSLYTGDKVVVTIWYRAPELLLGTRNYTPAIDLWAVGCILAELLSLRPIFKGEETKMDMNNKKLVPFQTNQFQKIIEILGSPTLDNWPSLNKYPEYSSFKQQLPNQYNPNLANWYKAVGGNNQFCLALLNGLLAYDPIERLTAENSLVHSFFLEKPTVSENAFEGLTFKYPKRRIYTDDNDIVSGGQVSKRHGFDDSKTRKRQR